MSPLNSYGSYLIRENETTPSGYVLSIRDRDRVQHYKILQSDNQKFFVYARSTFKTLQDLVAHYQQQADGLCVNLIKPCVILEPTDVSGQVIDEWQIDRGEIRLIRKLRSDVFTEVWKGIRNNTTMVAVAVAVMIFKPNKYKIVNDLLPPVNLIKKLQHPNIVRFYGVCSMEVPVYIITEFIKHNSLVEYLHERSLRLYQLMDMASQVAAGMAYLEEKNIVHRDLQASNVTVGANLVCKLAIFKLARVMHKDVYEGQKGENIAIKWAAPEVLLHSRFSIKSDVWSFGIVLYEIITHGKPPYVGMTDDEVKQQIQQGYRMPQSLGCPDKLYDIMLNCWRIEPANRPMFETLQQQLANLGNTGYNNIYSEFNGIVSDKGS
jgi:fyn-related kinase